MLSSAQIEARKKGVGGSDLAKLLRLKWGDEWDVFLEKTGMVVRPPSEMTELQRWGHLLERTIAEEYARRNKVTLLFPKETLKHPEHPFILGHPDALIEGQDKGLEIKTAIAWSRKEWGPSGTDLVPLYYLVQCAHYMAITGFHHWDLAVLIGGSDFRVYHLTRDLKLERSLIELCRKFWKSVEERTPPELTGSSGAMRYLRLTYPRHWEGAFREASEKESAIALKVRELKAKKKALQAELNEVKSEEVWAQIQIMASMKSMEEIQGPWGEVQWKTQIDGKRPIRFKFRKEKAGESSQAPKRDWKGHAGDVLHHDRRAEAESLSQTGSGD